MTSKQFQRALTTHELLVQAQQELLDGSQQKAHDYIDQAMSNIEQVSKDFSDEKGVK